MLFVFDWDLFKRQLIELSCELSFSENGEVGRPECGAQVSYYVVRVGSVFFRLIYG